MIWLPITRQFIITAPGTNIWSQVFISWSSSIWNSLWHLRHYMDIFGHQTLGLWGTCHVLLKSHWGYFAVWNVQWYIFYYRTVHRKFIWSCETFDSRNTSIPTPLSSPQGSVYFIDVSERYKQPVAMWCPCPVQAGRPGPGDRRQREALSQPRVRVSVQTPGIWLVFILVFLVMTNFLFAHFRGSKMFGLSDRM